MSLFWAGVGVGWGGVYYVKSVWTQNDWLLFASTFVAESNSLYLASSKQPSQFVEKKESAIVEPTN